MGPLEGEASTGNGLSLGLYGFICVHMGSYGPSIIGFIWVYHMKICFQRQLPEKSMATAWYLAAACAGPSGCRDWVGLKGHFFRKPFFFDARK